MCVSTGGLPSGGVALPPCPHTAVEHESRHERKTWNSRLRFRHRIGKDESGSRQGMHQFQQIQRKTDDISRLSSSSLVGSSNQPIAHRYNDSGQA